MNPADDDLTKEEQAQFDTMRDADAEPDTSGAATEPRQPAADGDATGAAADDTTAPSITPAKEPRPQTVPLASLQEERTRRKEAEDRAKLLEERTNLIIQRFATQQPQGQPQQPAVPVIPTLEQDPVGHMVGMQEQQQRNLAMVTQAVQNQLMQQRQQEQIQAIHARAVASENEFRATAPDYDDAVNYVMDKRNEQLRIAGVNDPGERFQMIRQEGLQLAAMAQQQGRNPAAVIYEMAKAFGHVAKAPTSTKNDNQPNDNEPNVTGQNDGTRLRQVQAGQEQGRSLGAVRGTAPSAITAQRILAMTESEFSTALDKASPDKLREMFGS